jgi:hypothetical protein
MTRSARVFVYVDCREGDGVDIAIRKGRCGVKVTATDATISWVDETWHCAAAMPIAGLQATRGSQSIVFLDTKGT